MNINEIDVSAPLTATGMTFSTGYTGPTVGLSVAAGALVVVVLAGLVELTTRHAFRADVAHRATWSLE